MNHSNLFPKRMSEANEEEKTNLKSAEKEIDGPSESDLVIRDGFPALRVPGTKWRPMTEGKEPIPRFDFWSAEDALAFDPIHLSTLLEDCETVFTARDKPDGAAYSAGQTYFLPANMKPRCALEGLAQSIFLKHVRHLEKGTYNPAQSGANWWTLVMDADHDGPSAKSGSEDDVDAGEDEVGLHFDADYELEEQANNLLLHPRVATVTYLSDYGAPTLILSQKSPPMDDIKKATLESGIKKAWLSHPKLGKHTAFDGRLLHGAPALYFPGNKNSRPAEEESAPKKVKIERKRYTLLVNVWLNHWVMDAGLLDDEICSRLKTPWENENCDLKGESDYSPPFKWNEIDLENPSKNISKIKLSVAKEDPAGEDELALCNHSVTIKYNPEMNECHNAAAAGGTVELDLQEGAITLHVGEELPEDDEE